MSIIRLLHSDIGKIFSGNIVIQITTILQTIIISRILGPEGKGEFVEIILWPTIISGFSILGLYTGIAKLCAKNSLYKKYNFARTSLLATSIVGTIGTIISLVFSPMLVSIENKGLKSSILIFSFFVLINNVARGFNAIDHGRKDFAMYSITRSILNPIFFLLLLILYILESINLFNIIFSFLLSNAIVCIARAIISLKRESQKTVNFPINKLFKYSLKFSISDFSEPIYTYYDKAILALVLSSYNLGLYTTAYSAAGVILLLSNGFGTKIFSELASRKAISLITDTIRQNTILMSLGGLFLSFCLPFLIPLIFGDDFSAAIIPSILLILVCIIQGQSFVIERGLLGLGYPLAGIYSKIGSMIFMAIAAFSFKILNMCNIYTLIMIVGISQLIYLGILIKKLFAISNQNLNIIPSIKDINCIIDQIKKS